MGNSGAIVHARFDQNIDGAAGPRSSPQCGPGYRGLGPRHAARSRQLLVERQRAIQADTHAQGNGRCAAALRQARARVTACDALGTCCAAGWLGVRTKRYRVGQDDRKLIE